MINLSIFKEIRLMSFSTLMYHEIRTEETLNAGCPSHIQVNQDYDDQLPKVLFVTLKKFEAQMAYLRDMNFHTLTLEEVKNFYYEDITLPTNSVLLTFDDCYQSVYHYAYPILKKYGFHAVAFVVTAWLNKNALAFDPNNSICLSEEALLTMSYIFEYANHTDTFHTRTGVDTSKLMTASSEDFAYPFGLYDNKAVATLKSMNFKLAFTTLAGKNLSSTDPLLLHRFAIPHFMPLDNFKELIG